MGWARLPSLLAILEDLSGPPHLEFHRDPKILRFDFLFFKKSVEHFYLQADLACIA
jgi:hypothetical protein